MIKEAYCSFEVAKLLKEKGFNEDCYTYYDDIGDSISRFDEGYHFNNTSYPWGVPYDISKAKKYVVAPTHQRAYDWLISKGVFFAVIPDYPSAPNKFMVMWYNNGEPSGGNIGFDTLYSAYEHGIKYSLKNLI